MTIIVHGKNLIQTRSTYWPDMAIKVDDEEIYQYLGHAKMQLVNNVAFQFEFDKHYAWAK